MADAATRWISPYYQSADPTNYAHVLVLNPGSADAKVTAHWFAASTGNQRKMEEKTVTHGTIQLFVPEAGTAEDGWLRLVSDQPIVPWGTTPYSPTGESLARAPMSFYRDEVLQLKTIHPVP
jgi:hypothetical protein